MGKGFKPTNDHLDIAEEMGESLLSKMKQDVDEGKGKSFDSIVSATIMHALIGIGRELQRANDRTEGFS